MLPAIERLSTAEGRPFWVLRTRQTAYVFGLDDRGYLQHVYWGAQLVLDSDYGFPGESHVWRAFERPKALTTEEFPAWGDLNFGEPCLKATFSDSVRCVLLEFVDSRIEQEGDRARLTITLKDPYYPLRVHLTYSPIPEYDLIERGVTIENTGDMPITVERIMTAAWNFPNHDLYRLRTLSGSWASEFQIQDVDLAMGKQVIERRRGAAGFDSYPWFALGADGADERHGEVWFGALAFGGNFKIVTERNGFGDVAVTGGINDFDFAWRLDAGERFTAPTFVAGFTEAGFGEASRLQHGYQIDYVVPRQTAHDLRPVVYNSWYATAREVSEANQIQIAERAAQLGVEMFVMDDGWFSTRTDPRSGLGDWNVDLRKFPNGLEPLIRRVNELGMKFGLWVEPEMVNPNTELYKAHPEWVYHFPNRPFSEGRNQLVLNFAREDVQAFAYDFLDELLTENNIAYFKWDMNWHFSEVGWLDAPAGRDREMWVRHTQGIYDLLAKLRARHPHVIIETCSGGGGRIDLGIMAYSEMFWTSDNTDPYDDLFMFEGFTQAFAPLTRFRLVTDPDEMNNERKFSLEYRFHVAMMGALGVGADIPRWSDSQMDEAKRLIATYKEIAETLQFGRVYRLLSPRDGSLSAVQFVSRAGHESVVFAFLHASRFGMQRVRLRLQGLDPDATYQVDGIEAPMSGQALMKRGIPVAMIGDYVSRMIRIRRLL